VLEGSKALLDNGNVEEAKLQVPEKRIYFLSVDFGSFCRWTLVKAKMVCGGTGFVRYIHA
jgi:hypothetical protein